MHSIYTGTYRLDIRNYNSEASHVYEHLLIRTFENYAAQNGFIPCLYGWLHGETFRDICFLEYGFYNPQVRDLFAQFMYDTKKIDLSLLDSEIERVAAEERSLLHLTDRQALLDTLERIDAERWEDVEASTAGIELLHTDCAERDPQIIQLKKSAKSFRDITIAIGIQDASLEEKALLLRTLPIINDAISRMTYDLGLYERDTSPVRYQHEYDALVACMIFTVKRGAHTIKDIENRVQHIIASLDLEPHGQELAHYAEGYVHTPTWNAFPIEYYKYAGLLVSKKQIASLMTPDNIQSLLKKLTIKATPTNQSHHDACRD